MSAMTKQNFLDNIKKQSLNEETSTGSVLGSPSSPNYGGFIGPLGRVNKRKLYSRIAYRDGGQIVEPPQGYLKEYLYSVSGSSITEGDLKHWFGVDTDKRPSWNGGKLVTMEPKCMAFPYCSQGAVDKPIKLIGENKEHMCPECYNYVSHIAEETGKAPEYIAKLIRERYLTLAE